MIEDVILVSFAFICCAGGLALLFIGLRNCIKLHKGKRCKSGSNIMYFLVAVVLICISAALLIYLRKTYNPFDYFKF